MRDNTDLAPEILSALDEEDEYSSQHSSRSGRAPLVKIPKGSAWLMRYIPVPLGPKGAFFARIAMHWVGGRPYLCIPKTGRNFGGDPDAKCVACDAADKLNNSSSRKTSSIGWKARAQIHFITHSLVFKKDDEVVRGEDKFVPHEHWMYENPFADFKNLVRKGSTRTVLSIMDWEVGCDLWVTNGKRGIVFEREDPSPIVKLNPEDPEKLERTIKKILSQVKFKDQPIPDDETMEEIAEKILEAGDFSRRRDRRDDDDRGRSRRRDDDDDDRGGRSRRDDDDDAPRSRNDRDDDAPRSRSSRDDDDDRSSRSRKDDDDDRKPSKKPRDEDDEPPRRSRNEDDEPPRRSRNEDDEPPRRSREEASSRRRNDDDDRGGRSRSREDNIHDEDDDDDKKKSHNEGDGDDEEGDGDDDQVDTSPNPPTKPRERERDREEAPRRGGNATSTVSDEEDNAPEEDRDPAPPAKKLSAIDEHEGEDEKPPQVTAPKTGAKSSGLSKRIVEGIKGANDRP